MEIERTVAPVLLIPYLSGTGNAEYVAQQLTKACRRGGLVTECESIESSSWDTMPDFHALIDAFPAYGIRPPRIMSEFLSQPPVGGMADYQRTAMGLIHHYLMAASAQLDRTEIGGGRGAAVIRTREASGYDEEQIDLQV